MATADELDLQPGDFVRVGNGIVYQSKKIGFIVFDFSFEIEGEGPRARILEKREEDVLVEYLDLCCFGDDLYPVGTLECIPRNYDCFRRDLSWMN